MSDEANTAQPAAPAENTPTEQPTEAPQPTLEDLYKEYSVDTPVAAQVQPQPPQPPTPTEQLPSVEDSQAAIKQELVAFRNELATHRAEIQHTTEQRDLQAAIAKIGDAAGLEGKDTLIKGYLLAKASDDPRLMTMWNNRTANPQAWDRALGVLANNVKSEIQVPNAQLEENQRAMEESQKGVSATAPAQKSAEQQVLGMSDEDFGKFWGQLTGRSRF